MFEPLDHNNQELKKFMENQGRTVYRSANSSSPEVHFSEEWIEGMPSFDSAGNMDGSSIEGFFYTYRDEHDLTNVSTAYIDFEIGEESGLLPIYYKTKNWQGDFSYHMSVPIGPLGEIYRPPYAILVIN